MWTNWQHPHRAKALVPLDSTDPHGLGVLSLPGSCCRSYSDSSVDLHHDTSRRQVEGFWAYPQVRACVADAR
jgi:hypothetical protein